MIRIVRGSPATLYATFYVDEAPADVDGQAATVTVTLGNGSQLVSTAATRVSEGVYSYALPPMAELATLRAVWTGLRSGVAVSTTTYAEVVGAEYFALGELRNFDSVLLNTTKYPNSKLIQARLFVANEFEGICGRAFVPRYAREVLYGDGHLSDRSYGTLWLSYPQLQRIISITVNGEDWADKSFSVPDDNLRVLNVTNASWPRGSQVIIEYEYGMPEPPIRIKEAAMKRAKYKLVADLSRIDERATTMNIPDFGNFILATPGMRGSKTGIPEVDVVLEDYVLGGG